MITLFGCAHFFNFVSFLLYPTEVKRLKCAMLGAFTVHAMVKRYTLFYFIDKNYAYLISMGILLKHLLKEFFHR